MVAPLRNVSHKDYATRGALFCLFCMTFYRVLKQASSSMR